MTAAVIENFGRLLAKHILNVELVENKRRSIDVMDVLFSSVSSSFCRELMRV